MEILNSVVESMSREEVRSFKLWLNSTNAADTRKDVLLFDYIRKTGDGFNEDFIFQKLYGKEGDKNSFYRLKHRLQEDVGYYLALMNFDKHEANNTFLYLSLYRIFLTRNKLKIAFYYLKKAEKRAMEAENYELLDLIYSYFIKLSYDMMEINPETYIGKRKENVLRVNQIRDVDQVLAAVNYRMLLSQNFGSRDVSLLKMLDNTIKEFAGDAVLQKSKNFMTRFYRAVSQSLLQSHNFRELEKFVADTYTRFETEKWFDKSNHDIKLQMLVYLCNALFRNGKHRESLDYAAELGEAIEAFNNLFYDKYMFYYYNILVINYSHLDLNRGLKALDELEREMKGKKNSYYEQFIILNKSNLLFFQQRYNEAVKTFVRLYLNDSYRKADETFKLKIAVAECIMHFESKDVSTTKMRVEQVRRQFRKMLPEETLKREVLVLSFIERLLVKDALTTDTALVKELKAFAKAKVPKHIAEDTEVINYRTWVAPKVGLDPGALNR